MSPQVTRPAGVPSLTLSLCPPARGTLTAMAQAIENISLGYKIYLFVKHGLGLNFTREFFILLHTQKKEDFSNQLQVPESNFPRIKRHSNLTWMVL